VPKQRYYKYEKGSKVYALLADYCGVPLGTPGEVRGRRDGPEYLVKFRGRIGFVAVPEEAITGDESKVALDYLDYFAIVGLATVWADMPATVTTMRVTLHTQDRKVVQGVRDALTAAGWVCTYAVPSSTAGLPVGVTMDFAKE
jgi:hypothetical protein